MSQTLQPLRFVHLPDRADVDAETAGVYVHIADLLYALDVAGEIPLRAGLVQLLDRFSPPAAPPR